MANVDGAQDAPPDAPAAPDGGGAPQGGGPIIAAMLRQRNAPQISAPGPGNQADSLNTLRTGIGLLQQALNGFEAGSKIHQDILTALRSLGRHMPQDSSTAGVEKTNLLDMIRNVGRNALLQRIMSQQQGGQGGQQAPMPSAPQPGV